jgi:hypothetical protein
VFELKKSGLTHGLPFTYKTGLNVQAFGASSIIDQKRATGKKVALYGFCA